MTRAIAVLTVMRCVRAFGFGFSAVLIGILLQLRGLSPVQVGATLAIAVLGSGATALGLASISTWIGRRRVLAITGALMMTSGLVLASSSPPWLLMMAGITGMAGVGSIDTGPHAPVEQAVLTGAVSDRQRNRMFARYYLSGGAAGSLGAIAASAGTSLNRIQFFFVAFAVIGLVTGALPTLLGRSAEVEHSKPGLRLTKRLLGLSGLFALDGGAGAFLLPSFVAYWLHLRYGLDTTALGFVYAASVGLQTASYEVSGRLGDRIGLINTMIWTHLPAQVFLVFIPFSSVAGLAVALYLANSSMVSMDVPARQAYLVSIVPPRDREGALAIAGAGRSAAQTCSPFISGLAVQFSVVGLPFFACAGLKLVYLSVLYAQFRHHRGGHELRGAPTDDHGGQYPADAPVPPEE